MRALLGFPFRGAKGGVRCGSRELSKAPLSGSRRYAAELIPPSVQDTTFLVRIWARTSVRWLGSWIRTLSKWPTRAPEVVTGNPQLSTAASFGAEQLDSASPT
jgi:hypothetical protein